MTKYRGSVEEARQRILATGSTSKDASRLAPRLAEIQEARRDRDARPYSWLGGRGGDEFMTGHEQHTVTVHVNEFRAYAVCTCIDPATDEPWRSPDAVSEPVARRYGEDHLPKRVLS